ncbi:phosphotransferase [Kineococcus arenarius]|uniref:phosphotransferase n=1 Tax=Kineococcus sp. SYSU DK007 TaxID=3383128 RepID=UPI003D7DFA6C
MTDTAWTSLPKAVHHCAHAELGAPITSWSDAVTAVQRPADRPAGIARTATGDALFLKAARTTDPFGLDYRAEAQLAAVLPAGVPTPRLRLAVEDEGWIVLGFDVATGYQPTEPWLPQQLRAVLAALDAAAPLLTPAPLSTLPTVAERMAGRCSTYGDLARTGHRDELHLEHLSDFERRHLERLVTLEESWKQAAAGDVLLHFDLRHDNVMLSQRADGADDIDCAANAAGNPAVTLLDWGRACTGQAWIDTACLLLLSDTGSVQPEDAFVASSRGAGADPWAVDSFLVALASYWRHAAARPVPLQSAQAQARRHASGEASVRWLRTRWV